MLGPNGSGKTTLLSTIGLELWPTAGTVDVLGARYGRVDSRELRRRIGTASSAVEAALRPDLTPVTLVMTARHAATEPWWHVYTDDDRARARGLLEGLGLGARGGSAVRDVVRGRATADLDRPGADARPGPAAPRRAGREPRPGRPRDADRRPDVACAPARPEAIVLVSHHVEEIPPGFRHALVLADGRRGRRRARSRPCCPTMCSPAPTGCRSRSSGATGAPGRGKTRRRR